MYVNNLIICFCIFIAQPPKGYITKHGQSTGLREISKHDLGKFFVDCLFQPEHYQKVIGIASNPA